MQIEQEIIAVLTDTFHKPEFYWHVFVLQRLFQLVKNLYIYIYTHLKIYHMLVSVDLEGGPLI